MHAASSELPALQSGHAPLQVDQRHLAVDVEDSAVINARGLSLRLPRAPSPAPGMSLIRPSWRGSSSNRSGICSAMRSSIPIVSRRANSTCWALPAGSGDLPRPRSRKPRADRNFRPPRRAERGLVDLNQNEPRKGSSGTTEVTDGCRAWDYRAAFNLIVGKATFPTRLPLQKWTQTSMIARRRSKPSVRR